MYVALIRERVDYSVREGSDLVIGVSPHPQAEEDLREGDVKRRLLLTSQVNVISVIEDWQEVDESMEKSTESCA